MEKSVGAGCGVVTMACGFGSTKPSLYLQCRRSSSYDVRQVGSGCGVAVISFFI